MQIGHLGIASLARAIFRNQFHRAGPIEGYQRDDVFESVWFKVARGPLHTGRFHLEYGPGLAAGIQLVGLFISQRHREHVHMLSTRTGDGIQCGLDDRQGLEPQKIKLHQTDGFQIFHVELGTQTSATGLAQQRRVGRQRFRRNDNTARMHAHATGDALQL